MSIEVIGEGQTVVIEAPPPPAAAVVVEAPQRPATTVEIHVPGPQGAPGAAGASSASYSHVQTTSSAIWTVIHNLGYVPAGFLVRDTSGQEVEPVVSTSTTQASVLLFEDPIAGIADVS